MDKTGTAGPRASGLRVDGKLHKNTTSVIQPFAEVNWLHTSDDVGVAFDGAEVKQDLPADRAEVKVGIRANLNSQWSITGQVAGQKDVMTMAISAVVCSYVTAGN